MHLVPGLPPPPFTADAHPLTITRDLVREALPPDTRCTHTSNRGKRRNAVISYTRQQCEHEPCTRWLASVTRGDHSRGSGRTVVTYPELYPFVWFPLAGQRHAIDRGDRHVSVGRPMRCLCGAIHPRGAEGDMELLWRTCEQCWDKACLIVGARKRE